VATRLQGLAESTLTPSSSPSPCPPHLHLRASLQALHARLEPLLLFFVDAASPIDPEDEGWHLFMAVEQSEEGAEVLGFATAYR